MAAQRHGFFLLEIGAVGHACVDESLAVYEGEMWGTCANLPGGAG